MQVATIDGWEENKIVITEIQGEVYFMVKKVVNEKGISEQMQQLLIYSKKGIRNWKKSNWNSK